MNAQQWLAAYADRLDLDPPTPDELDAILALAGVAAHASERIAAPAACWLSARAGRPLDDSLRIAREVST
ncbi:MAG TPA: DUF6457 domain-containing protein [Thermoleophilaceae bacterium]